MTRSLAALLTAIVLCAGVSAQTATGFEQMHFDFERGEYAPESLLEGWLWTHAEDAEVKAGAVTEGARGGERCLEIESAGGWALIAGPKVNCRPQAAEEGPFSCVGLGWVRVEGDEATALIKADFLAEDGAYLGSVESPRVSGNHPWTPVGFCREVSSTRFADAVTMRIAFVIEGVGKAWFDDGLFRYWAPTTGADSPDNRVLNPGFDAGLGDIAQNWGYSSEPPGAFTIQRTSWWPEQAPQIAPLPGFTPPGRPDPCLRISGQGGFGLAIAPVVPLEQGAGYTVSARVRVEGAEARAIVKIDFFQGTDYLGSAQAEPVSGFSDWQTVSVTSEAGQFPQAAALAAVVVLEGKGTAWYDDVALEKQ